MNLLEIRQKYGLSQLQAAMSLDIPVRTYIRYEKDDSYGSDLKRRTMILDLIDKYEITEDKGIITIDYIKQKLNKVLLTSW